MTWVAHQPLVTWVVARRRKVDQQMTWVVDQWWKWEADHNLKWVGVGVGQK